MDAKSLFEHWRALRGSDNYDPLSKPGARSYEAIWLSWTRWLSEREPGPDGQHTGYLDASAIDIANFLVSGPSPRSARRARKPLSDITRRRYWRVIDSVYAHAVELKLLTDNPAAGLIGSDKPPPEKSFGQVFNPKQLAALENALPVGPNIWKLRDRAMFELMLREALSVSELCELSMGDITPNLVDKGHYVLSIQGQRKAQERKINMDAPASAALADWLAQPMVRGFDSDEPVFVTERRRRISPRVVFHMVSSTVVRAFAAADLDLPLHIGPQVLRNTCVVNWVNAGMNVDVALIRAGLKDQNSLRGLREHISSRSHAPVNFN